MNHHVKCFAIVVVILPVEWNYFVPTKIGCFQNFFPGLQEPAILETDYVMVRSFVYFSHREHLPVLQSHLFTRPQAPPRAEARQVTPVQQSGLQAGRQGNRRTGLTLYPESFLVL